jgi:hypothetical protein
MAGATDIMNRRLERLQSIADMLTEKLQQRVAQEDPATMNPQAIKHITGVLKDLRDIQLTSPEQDRDASVITVLWEGEVAQYSG